LVFLILGRLEAAPLLFFLNQPAAVPQQLIFEVGVPFEINVDASGNFSQLYQNATGMAIPNFHFRSSVPEDSLWVGGGGAPPPFFQSVFPSADRMGIDFNQGPLGSGILPGMIFEITGTAFTANTGTSLIATATVPEPATAALFCVGLLGLMGRVMATNLKSRCSALHGLRLQRHGSLLPHRSAGRQV
jgi:hypothetical protein